MNFAHSSHKRDWLFDAETLKQRYAQAQQQAVQTIESQRTSDAEAAPDAKKPRGDSPITLEEEVILKQYYQQSLKTICSQKHLPSKVLNAALIYFKRFYSQASCVEHDPMRVMVTCIYLACKVEEAYHSAEGLCGALGLKADTVLRFEVPLLQGLQFDLVVHSPYRALAGLFKEFDQLRSQQSPALDAALLSAPSDALSAAHAKSRAALDHLMLTDAPLLHPPGALAVAAMRSGFRSCHLSCQQYLRHVAQKAAAAAASSDVAAAPAADVERHQQQLLEALAAIDQLGAQQVVLDEAGTARAAQIDKRVKVWKNPKKQPAAAGPGAAAAAAAGPGGTS